MKRRLTILIIILAFGTVLFLLLPHQDTGRHMPWLPDTPLVSPVRELPLKNKVADARPALAPIIPLAGHDLDPEPDEPLLEPPEVSPPEPDILEPGAIPGEYVLSFNNKKDLLTFLFLTLASLHGIEILDISDFGHTVRLRVKNRVVLDDLLEESPTPADFGPNYFVYAPDPPEQHPLAPQTGYMGFGNQALEWLGVPSDHATWGTGVTVAVLDSGVDSHPALAEQKISRKSLLNDETTGLAKYGGHGTSVASIIAGTSPDLSEMASRSASKAELTDCSMRVASGGTPATVTPNSSGLDSPSDGSIWTIESPSRPSEVTWKRSASRIVTSASEIARVSSTRAGASGDCWRSEMAATRPTTSPLYTTRAPFSMSTRPGKVT